MDHLTHRLCADVEVVASGVGIDAGLRQEWVVAGVVVAADADVVGAGLEIGNDLGEEGLVSRIVVVGDFLAVSIKEAEDGVNSRRLDVAAAVAQEAGADGDASAFCLDVTTRNGLAAGVEFLDLGACDIHREAEQVDVLRDQATKA